MPRGYGYRAPAYPQLEELYELTPDYRQVPGYRFNPQATDRSYQADASGMTSPTTGWR